MIVFPFGERSGRAFEHSIHENINCIETRTEIKHRLQQFNDLTADEQNKNERFIFSVYRTFWRIHTAKQNNNKKQKVTTIHRRRSQSGALKNNEKYCFFAQTLESDEPIKLVAQIKTNYNVGIQMMRSAQ